MKAANAVLSGYGTTIFEVMSRLAKEAEAINLGQGFPDEDGPEEIRRLAAEAVVDGPNQYPPMLGLPELRRAVAEHERRFYGLGVDWQNEVMVTSGATEALADCLFGLDCEVGQGDAARLGPAARGVERRLQRTHQADRLEQSDEPGGQGVRRGRARFHRRIGRAP
jgi:hypothetical protein